MSEMSVCDANLAMAMAIAMKRPAASFPSRAAPARRLSPARPPLPHCPAHASPRQTQTQTRLPSLTAECPARQPSPNDAVAIAAAPTPSPPIFSRQTNARSDTRLGSCRARLFPRTLMAGDTKYPGPHAVSLPESPIATTPSASCHAGCGSFTSNPPCCAAVFRSALALNPPCFHTVPGCSRAPSEPRLRRGKASSAHDSAVQLPFPGLPVLRSSPLPPLVCWSSS